MQFIQHFCWAFTEVTRMPKDNKHSGKSESRRGGSSNRSEAAKKGWETRRRNMTSKSRSK